MNMSKQKLLLQLTLDSDGKVAGLFFKDGKLLDTPAEANAENQDSPLPAVSQDGSVPTPTVSQEITIPEGIVEEDIIVGEGEWALPGTLTLPKDGSSFPAVVLVHGSGPNNRDESVGQTKMFRDLAWALAQKGIASIRYDKRTLAYTDKFTFEFIKTLTVREETTIDAVLAGKVLKDDSRIDGSRIFVAGHSLGAMLGPRIVKEGEDLFAGMILMNGSPLQLTDIILTQNEDLLAEQPEDTRKALQPLVDMEVEKLKGIDTMTDDLLKEEIIFGMPGYYVKDLRTYDAAVTLKELQLPTFIAQGGADFQVNLANGWDAWQKAVGGERYITLKLYPDLNHLLMKYTGDPAYQYSLQEYDTLAKMDETAEADIASWILDH
jgi:alpha-beta hydrolase superfamily lysophospholipase